jgi:hypothetical protein
MSGLAVLVLIEFYLLVPIGDIEEKMLLVFGKFRKRPGVPRQLQALFREIGLEPICGLDLWPRFWS